MIYFGSGFEFEVSEVSIKTWTKGIGKGGHLFSLSWVQNGFKKLSKEVIMWYSLNWTYKFDYLTITNLHFTYKNWIQIDLTWNWSKWSSDRKYNKVNNRLECYQTSDNKMTVRFEIKDIFVTNKTITEKVREVSSNSRSRFRVKSTEFHRGEVYRISLEVKFTGFPRGWNLQTFCWEWNLQNCLGLKSTEFCYECDNYRISSRWILQKNSSGWNLQSFFVMKSTEFLRSSFSASRRLWRVRRHIPPETWTK